MSEQAIIRVLTNIGVLFAGTISRMLLSFAFVLYAARELGVNGFGKFALVQHFFEFCLSMVATAISIWLTREVARDRSALPTRLTAATVLAGLLSIPAGLTLLVAPTVMGYSTETQLAMATCAVAIFPAAGCQLAEATFLGLERAKFITYGMLLESLLRIAASFALISIGFGIVPLFMVLIASRFITLAFYAVCLRALVPAMSWQWSASEFRAHVRDWWVFALENWATNFRKSVPLIVLSKFHGEAAVGIFAAAMKVLRLGIVAAASFTQAMYPYLARLYGESRSAFERISTGALQYLLAIVLPAVITICILSDHVILLLYSTDYAASIPILRVGVWSLLLAFVNPFLSHTLFARGEQSASLRVAIVHFAVCLVLSLLLIPEYGGIGAAIATVASAVIATFSYLSQVLRREEWHAVSTALLRALLPSTVLAVYLLTIPASWHLALQLVSGGVLYVASLFALGVVSVHDATVLFRHRQRISPQE